MEDSVINFYNKENDENYFEKYNREHGPRLDFIFDRYNFINIKDKFIADFGGGFGYFIDKFNSSNDRTIIDGTTVNITRTNYFIDNNIQYMTRDLNELMSEKNIFNVSFCFEVLEHLSNPYNCLLSIKNTTILDGEIYLSIPHERTTHNTIYPGLFYPESNFEQFLEQMALPIEDKVFCDKSFYSWIYKCKNRPWREKKMKWPKEDAKYIDVSPLDLTNL